MNPDGLSYLDMASETLTGGPSKLVNGYWSPGYPALISAAFFLFRPSSAQEFPIIHLLNLFIFVFVLWSFSVFLRHWLAIVLEGEVTDKKKSYAEHFAYSTFFTSIFIFIGVRVVSPDLCVAGIVLLAAGLTCRLSMPRSQWSHYLALGGVLGIGYYVKAAMFPLSLAFLVILSLLPSSSGVNRKKLTLSLLAFMIVATPLVILISKRVERVSFGESGRLTYAWFVNGLPRYAGWTGEAPDIYGIPEHAPRSLMDKPLTLEFGTPIGGTFPLWYEPSYWYAGAKATFDLPKQMKAIAVTIRENTTLLFCAEAVFIGALVLYTAMFTDTTSKVISSKQWWQVAWPLSAFAMYALVHVETRFLGGFFVLLWLGVYVPVIFRVEERVRTAVCASVVFTLMILLGAQVTAEVAPSIRDAVLARPPDYQAEALGLNRLGVQNGDSLAVVGDAFNAYYARYARLRIVAEIPQADEFWRLSDIELRSIAQRLSSIGVKAIVAQNRPETSPVGNWKDVSVSDPSIRLSVLRLSLEVAKIP